MPVQYLFRRAPQMGILLASMVSSPYAAAQNCVPGVWQSPPNTYWDSVNGSFPVQAESPHFQIRWPASKPTLLTPDQAKAALNAMESILAWFTGPQVKWPEPFCDSAVKDKIQIFTNDGYGLSGAGGGPRTPAMWVGPGALKDAGIGLVGGMVHEFTHSMQFNSMGMRNTQFGGWAWESHAEFMAHQYPGNSDKIGCTFYLAWMPQIYFGSTRDRYCNWQFWDYLKNKYGFRVVNDMWVKTAKLDGQDPLAALMRNQGWSAAALGDEFGHFAMKNVNWDYVDAQDGFDRGAAYRKAYGKNTELAETQGWAAGKHNRLTRLEPIDLNRRRFVVSTYYAPQRLAHNLVRLIPDAGASAITVNFRGVVQAAVAPGADVGTGKFQPGASPDWVDFTLPTNPASNWRWGVVAIDQGGKSRYSALQRGASADLTFPIQATDAEFYLVVVATPDDYHPVFWDQMYHTLYRYPYKVQLSGAWPDGYQPGYRLEVAHGYPAGHKHANGGGWVADGAVVDASVYVGPFAAVLGGTVTGNARIEDYAAVWNGTVQDNAVVGGLTHLNTNMTVAGRAQVRSVMAGGQTFDNGTVLNGTVKLYGDLETHLGTVPASAGAYSGFIVKETLVDPTLGSARTDAPVEVTAPVPPGWPDAPANTAPTIRITAPATAAQGTPLTIAAEAADTDGSIAQVEFFDGSTLIGTLNTKPFNLSWTPDSPGSHVLTARATDNAGAVTVSASATVGVAGGSVPAPPASSPSASQAESGGGSFDPWALLGLVAILAAMAGTARSGRRSEEETPRPEVAALD